MPDRVEAQVVGVIPFWSQSEALNWDSNFVFLDRLLPRLADRFPHWVWVVFWPNSATSDQNRWHIYERDFFRPGTIVPFSWPYLTSMQRGVLAFSERRFAELEKIYSPTLYWCQEVEIIPSLYQGVDSTSLSNQKANAKIVAQQMYIPHRSLPYPWYNQLQRLWPQMGGALMADEVVVGSEWCWKMQRESYSEFLSADAQAKIENHTRLFYMGLVEQWMIAEPIRSYSKPVFVYNHRFEAYKNPTDTATTWRALRAEGLDFEVWATQHHAQSKNLLPIDRIVGAADPRVYMTNIAVPAINTFNSRHETFCIALSDSLALGHLLVLPRRCTFPELVPPNYPYLFDSLGEQQEMLRHILRGWPDTYTEWSGRLRQYAWSKFGIDHIVDQYADLLTHLGTAWHVQQSKPHIQARSEIFWNTLRRETARVCDIYALHGKALGLASQAMPMRWTIRELAALGGRFTVGMDSDLYVHWT